VEEITARLLAFIRQRFLDDDTQTKLTETTPLLEWGILSSLNMVVLLEHIRAEFGSPVPPDRINARHFRNVATIAAMVHDLQAVRA